MQSAQIPAYSLHLTSSISQSYTYHLPTPCKEGAKPTCRLTSNKPSSGILANRICLSARACSLCLSSKLDPPAEAVEAIPPGPPTPPPNAGDPNLEPGVSPFPPPNPKPSPRPAGAAAAAELGEPNNVPSAILSRIAFSTLDSQTPSHFHALGCFGEDGEVDEEDPVAGAAASAADASAPAPVVMGEVILRCACQACQALGLPAEESGRLSRMEGSVKEEWMWWRRFRRVVLRSVCAGIAVVAGAGSAGTGFGLDGFDSEVLVDRWSGSSCVRSVSSFFTSSDDGPLSLSRVVVVLSRGPPHANHSGKP